MRDAASGRDNVHECQSTCFQHRRMQLTMPEMTPFPSSHVYRVQYNHIRARPTSELTHSIIDDIVSALDRAIERNRRLYRRTTRSGECGFMLRLRVQRYMHVVQNLFEHFWGRQSGGFGFGQRLIRPEEVLLVGDL